MSIKIPYKRKEETLTLLVFSAIALLLSSPLLLSNFLIQPVQASSIGSPSSSSSVAMTFRTLGSADGHIGSFSTCEATLTFDAQGTNSSGSQTMNGTFQIASSDGGEIWASGKILKGKYSNSTNEGGESIGMGALVGNANSSQDCVPQETSAFTINAGCSTSDTNSIGLVDFYGQFNGAVECSPSHAGGDTTHSSVTGTTTTTYDSNRDSRDGDDDRDGIPDSSDRCPHNSNHRCFKEGGDTTSTTTTTHDQQPSSTSPSTSSSSSSGNQTR